MHIAVIGTGYVGLVTGACFAEFGVEVTCVDHDEEKIERLKQGIIPIHEPGLEEIVKKNYASGRLHFTIDTKAAVEQAEIVFLAVGTPPNEDGSPDMSFYWKAAGEIAAAMNGYKVLVTKSTVPVETGQELRKFIEQRVGPDIKFGVASNPEFLREGAAIKDFMKPDRVVIGSEDEKAIGIMKNLYLPFDLLEIPIVTTSLEAAELIKYASNAFLATKITFMNEIANLCEAIGCDVEDVRHGIGLDSRIGKDFLHPGPGYGGSCFPKDTSAFTKVGKKFGVETSVVSAVIDANKRQRQVMIDKIKKLVGDLSGKQIAVLGLAFKADTDDMRESPAVDIIRKMVADGARVKAFDPQAMENAKGEDYLPDIDYADNEYDAIKDADALVIITEWSQFVRLDMDEVKRLLKSPKIADLRNIYKPKEMKKHGFEYVSVGR